MISTRILIFHKDIPKKIDLPKKIYAIELALAFDIAPKTFHRYVDDSHVRFGSRNNATEFLNVLNSQDPQIQYTIEYENDNKELNFLDVTISNNLNHSYDFAVYRKPVITNTKIKPKLKRKLSLEP